MVRATLSDYGHFGAGPTNSAFDSSRTTSQDAPRAIEQRGGANLVRDLGLNSVLRRSQNPIFKRSTHQRFSFSDHRNSSGIDAKELELRGCIAASKYHNIADEAQCCALALERVNERGCLEIPQFECDHKDTATDIEKLAVSRSRDGQETERISRFSNPLRARRPVSDFSPPVSQSRALRSSGSCRPHSRRSRARCG